MEQLHYDDAGQLLTGSLMDYALPRAADIPTIRLDHQETPTAANKLGSKGVGEAGAIGAPGAIVNAVCDALAQYGIDSVPLPMTPFNIWRTLQAATRSSSQG